MDVQWCSPKGTSKDSSWRDSDMSTVSTMKFESNKIHVQEVDGIAGLHLSSS